MTVARRVVSQRDIALIDLIDRLLSGGVVLSGDITLSIADVDLVDLCLRVLITPSDRDLERPE
jgi:Gas vesicle protein